MCLYLVSIIGNQRGRFSLIAFFILKIFECEKVILANLVYYFSPFHFNARYNACKNTEKNSIEQRKRQEKEDNLQKSQKQFRAMRLRPAYIRRYSGLFQTVYFLII
jgi:hypothetical protein